MAISDVAKPVMQAILGGKQEKAPKGSLEEAQEMIASIAREIDELTQRKPSTDVALERKRLEDLAVAERTKMAWQSVRDGIIKEQAAQKLAAAKAVAQEAKTAAHWSQEDKDVVLKAYATLKKRKALCEEEYRATAVLSILESPNGGGMGESAQLHILTQGVKGYGELLLALEFAG